MTKVQRVHPETGEKSKLRKSYRRFTQHLPGKDDVVITKTDLGQYMRDAHQTDGNKNWEGQDKSRTRLYWLNGYPEEDWRNTQASYDQKIPRDLSATKWTDLKTKLAGGLKKWTPGPLEGVSTNFYC